MIFLLQIWLSWTWTRIQKNCWIRIRKKADPQPCSEEKSFGSATLSVPILGAKAMSCTGSWMLVNVSTLVHLRAASEYSYTDTLP